MPTLNEVPEVAKLLATILTGEPVTHGALAVIPLLAPNLDGPDWLTLEEAGGRARVTEVSEAGSVPFLEVANGPTGRSCCWTARSRLSGQGRRAAVRSVAWRACRAHAGGGPGRGVPTWRPGLAGAALVAQRRVAHLMAFPAAESPRVNQ